MISSYNVINKEFEFENEIRIIKKISDKDMYVIEFNNSRLH